MVETTQSDVAIIGYGPVGAAMALSLAGYGLSVRIFERTNAPYALPRAVQLDDEVMRLLRLLGVDEAARAKMHVNPGTKFIAPSGEVLIDWSRPEAETPLGWRASYRFHQPDLEETLRTKVAATSSIAVELKTEAQGLSPTPNGAIVQREDGTRHKARYVIGCDGANSKTRPWIGSSWDDLGFQERWLVLDLIEADTAPDLGDHTLQVCHPDHPATIVRGVRPRRRFEFRLGDESVEEAKTPAAVWRRLSPWITPEQAWLERVAVYEFRSTIATKWRVGRVFLAGDAAHLTPPFMGQGMCVGMRDVANLGWKIAAHARGAEEAILDSYQTERAPHAREYTEMAVAMGQFLNRTAADVLSGHAVQGDGEAAKLGMIRPPLGPGFGERGAVAGHLAPQPLLTHKTRMEDATRGRFAILAQPGLGIDQGPACLIRDPAVTKWLREIGAVAALLRPDGYISHIARDEAEANMLSKSALTL